MTSEQIIEMFNQAANLARTGKQKQALESYEAIAEAKAGTTNIEVTAGDFFAVVELRKVFCLTELGRHAEARRILESEKMKALLPTFQHATMYDYFFCYGNTLGNLGETLRMEDCLARALAIAAGELGDLEKSENCWYFIMYWAKQHKKWDFLEKQCVAAHIFGTDNDSIFLQSKALEFGFFAYNGLGKTDKARQAATVVLKRLQASGEQGADLVKWKKFLAKLAAA